MTRAWQALAGPSRDHARRPHLRDLFARRSRALRALLAAIRRPAARLLQAPDRRRDHALLLELARQADVEGWRDHDVRAGEKINLTEDRAVLHVALRNRANRPILVDGTDVMPEVNARAGAHGASSPSRCASGAWRGYTGQRITDIVNIGIGGSDLGPADGLRGARALRHRACARTSSPTSTARTWRHARGLDPERTLFIVASKTFTTQETMTNAGSARAWLLAKLGGDAARSRATSSPSRPTRPRCASSASTPPTCSASGTGSAAATRCGRRSACRSRSPSAWTGFQELLAGAHAMDEHFRTAPLEQNLPVVLALLGVWYNNFLGAAEPRHPALRPVPRPLRRLLPAGRHGEQRQAGRPRGQRVDYADRPDHLGRARHQRPARLLPADPPGHQADPLRLPRRRPQARRRSATTTTSCSPTSSPRPRRWPSARPRPRPRRGGTGRAPEPRSQPTPKRRARAPTPLPPPRPPRWRLADRHKILSGNRRHSILTRGRTSGDRRSS